MQNLLDFIRTRPFLKRSKIAKEAGINVQLFSDVLNRARELSQKHIPLREFDDFYCADWNRCGAICEEQCNACGKAENMPESLFNQP